MDPVRYTVEVDSEGVCLLQTPFDPRVRRLVRAIPGRFWDEEAHGWTIRLGPDRAEAVARLLRAFPVFEPAPGAMRQIEALRRQRDRSRPGIETVKPEEEFCLSFCDDWRHPVVDEMRRFFTYRPYPEI